MVSIKDQGQIGEQALNEWLKEQKLSYVAVCQSTETFSPLFSADVKRPDFLLLFEALGMIAVDVKNYKLSGGVFTLELEAELRRSIAFERLFRLPVWYAYCDENNFGKEWHWISALKAIEVGEVRKNSKKSTSFLAIKKEHFEHIASAIDLSKLYTHRLPSVAKISATPLK
jgi:hypothetical protein